MDTDMVVTNMVVTQHRVLFSGCKVKVGLILVDVKHSLAKKEILQPEKRTLI
jgi:hypothetical protein